MDDGPVGSRRKPPHIPVQPSGKKTTRSTAQCGPIPREALRSTSPRSIVTSASCLSTTLRPIGSVHDLPDLLQKASPPPLASSIVPSTRSFSAQPPRRTRPPRASRSRRCRRCGCRLSLAERRNDQHQCSAPVTIQLLFQVSVAELSAAVPRGRAAHPAGRGADRAGDSGKLLVLVGQP